MEINIEANWTDANDYFDNARRNGQTLFAVITAADTNSVVAYFARISSIAINKKSNTYYTGIGIDNLTIVQSKVKTSSLKGDDGKSVSSKDSFDCAVVETPMVVYEQLSHK